MPESGELSSATIKRWRCANSLYANFFKTIFTGRAEVISRALERIPFEDMKQLSDAVKRLRIPYDEALIGLFENKIKALAETG